MFIKELSIYVAYLKELVTVALAAPDPKKAKHITTFYNNLNDGIAYYESKLDNFFDKNSNDSKYAFANALNNYKRELKDLVAPVLSNTFSLN